MSLSPLPPLSTRVDACTEALQVAILDGTFSAGSRLPAERSLADTLNVTRITLRSALARLSARGLVHAHQGRGTTVRDFLRIGGPDLIGKLLELQSGGADRVSIVRDLLAVRRALAGLVLERVVAVSSDPSDTQAAIAAFGVAVQAGAEPAELADADGEILRALLAQTGSPVLQLCLNPIVAVLRSSPPLQAAVYRAPQENAAGWRALAAWLDSPDVTSVPVLVGVLAQQDADTCAHVDGM